MINDTMLISYLVFYKKNIFIQDKANSKSLFYNVACNYSINKNYVIKKHNEKNIIMREKMKCIYILL